MEFSYWRLKVGVVTMDDWFDGWTGDGLCIRTPV